MNISDSILTVGTAIKKSNLSYCAIHKKNQRINIKNNEQICFLETGTISFFRVHDDVLTISMSAPCVAGVAQMLYQHQTHYIRCDKECTLWTINIADAIQLFSTQNLWIHVYNILSKQTYQYFEREYFILQKNSRGIIMQYLKLIWNMTEDERANTSIYNFILSRNHISRSGIHKVLSELQNEGKIKTRRGRLVFFQL